MTQIEITQIPKVFAQRATLSVVCQEDHTRNMAWGGFRNTVVAVNCVA